MGLKRQIKRRFFTITSSFFSNEGKREIKAHCFFIPLIFDNPLSTLQNWSDVWDYWRVFYRLSGTGYALIQQQLYMPHHMRLNETFFLLFGEGLLFLHHDFFDVTAWNGLYILWILVLPHLGHFTASSVFSFNEQ